MVLAKAAASSALRSPPGRLRRRLRALAVPLLPWLGMGWISTSQLYLAWRDEDPLGLGRALLWQGAPWLVWALWTPLVVRLGRRLPVLEPGRRAAAIPVHLCAALAVAAQYFALSVLFGRLIGLPSYLARPLWPQVLGLLARLGDVQLIVYAAVLAIDYAATLRRKRQEDALQAARLAEQLAHAQLASLKRQIHPHFLFNTLHTIGLLVRKQDRDGALQVLSRLGELLRAVLDEDERQLVTLREELDLLERYLAIERVRFQDRLQVELRIDPAALPLLVPNLILQPLVENALRHGLAPRAAAGRLSVRAERLGDRLRLQVEDDGAGLPRSGPLREGTGLRNTRERLRHLYPEAHRLRIEPQPEGLRVELELPARPEAAHG